MGQIALSAALDFASNRSTISGSNGVSFSYRATRAFWQNEDRGWK
jgi:hypothetical protein